MDTNANNGQPPKKQGISVGIDPTRGLVVVSVPDIPAAAEGKPLNIGMPVAEALLLANSILNCGIRLLMPQGPPKPPEEPMPRLVL